MSNDRAQSAYDFRVEAANFARNREHPKHEANPDEPRYGTACYPMNFTKGLETHHTQPRWSFTPGISSCPHSFAMGSWCPASGSLVNEVDIQSWIWRTFISQRVGGVVAKQIQKKLDFEIKEVEDENSPQKKANHETADSKETNPNEKASKHPSRKHSKETSHPEKESSLDSKGEKYQSSLEKLNNNKTGNKEEKSITGTIIQKRKRVPKRRWFGVTRLGKP